MSTNSPAEPEKAKDADLSFETRPPSRGSQPTVAPENSAASGPLVLQAGMFPLPEYQLIRKLGEGGFGQVWHAGGPGGLDVALKFIRLDVHGSALEVRALEVMKTIRHPNLVGVFGAWCENNVLILAMELCDRTLYDRLKETLKEDPPGIPIGELLDYMRDAARGIDTINAQHIQHRDVKPMNLLLLANGVKVADFGLAKVLNVTAASNTGTMTIAYAAPECFKGEITKQSDQYSLAATYFHLRTGRLVFGGSMGEVMFGHVNEEPNLTGLPNPERTVVARALSKSPGERWPSCTAFVSALMEAHYGTPSKSLVPVILKISKTQRLPVAPVKKPRRRGPIIAILMVFLALAGSGLLAAIFWPQLAALRAPLTHPPETIVEAARLTADEPPDVDTQQPQGKPQEGEPLPGVAKLPDPEPKQPPKTYENAIGMKFVWVEPGTFQMGSPDDEKERNEDEKQHRVTVTRGYYMAVTPVTQKQWLALMSENPSNFKGDDLPVENVSWDDCQEFCKKLREKEGKPYRLPTEAEWEYACRAGSPTAYFFGDDPKKLEDHAWYDGNSKKQTHPVATKKANAWGLYDLHGNVWQWCADYYGPYEGLPEKDPFRSEKAMDEKRVLRGGSWDGNAGYCRASYRSNVPPTNREDDLGFRVVFRPD